MPELQRSGPLLVDVPVERLAGQGKRAQVDILKELKGGRVIWHSTSEGKVQNDLGEYVVGEWKGRKR